MDPINSRLPANISAKVSKNRLLLGSTISCFAIFCNNCIFSGVVSSSRVFESLKTINIRALLLLANHFLVRAIFFLTINKGRHPLPDVVDTLIRPSLIFQDILVNILINPFLLRHLNCLTNNSGFL